MHEKFQACIDACNACALTCSHCASACIGEAKPELADCVRLDLDCAATCRLATEVMGRGGPAAQQICRVCADVCDACAKECDQYPMDHCKECAAACRACAKACRAMA